MKKALFIHRSVGHHLIEQGGLRRLFNQKGFVLDDYDNNSGILMHADGSSSSNAIQMPGNNTNPANLADFFSEWLELLNQYDLIAIKSCYPNSHIKDEAQLNQIKQSYESIIKSFASHNKKLLILTSPPLRPLMTNKKEALFSDRLADWLVSQRDTDLLIFDFHRALSASFGRHKGMLKREYRRLLPVDNHPNRKAHETIAPQIAAVLS